VEEGLEASVEGELKLLIFFFGQLFRDVTFFRPGFSFANGFNGYNGGVGFNGYTPGNVTCFQYIKGIVS
jgi:hypothetical protein